MSGNGDDALQSGKELVIRHRTERGCCDVIPAQGPRACVEIAMNITPLPKLPPHYAARWRITAAERNDDGTLTVEVFDKATKETTEYDIDVGTQREVEPAAPPPAAPPPAPAPPRQVQPFATVMGDPAQLLREMLGTGSD
jgi:hypothetical protein